jgi:hypothetical protein
MRFAGPAPDAEAACEHGVRHRTANLKEGFVMSKNTLSAVGVVAVVSILAATLLPVLSMVVLGLLALLVPVLVIVAPIALVAGLVYLLRPSSATPAVTQASPSVTAPALSAR